MDKSENDKSSGNGWIGDIPAIWKTASLKWLSNIYSGGTPDRNNEDYWSGGTIPWLNSGKVNDFVITEPSDFITEEGFRNSSAKWIEPNSVVVALAGQGKTKGMSAIVTFPATCNQSLAVIRPSQKLHGKYLLYFLSRNYYHIRGLAGDGIRDGLNLEMIGGLAIPLFDVEEQSKIAKFLDCKTAELDELVANKQKLIQLLKEERTAIINRAVTKGINPNATLKRSGVDWLGSIPEHWEVKKLKWVCKITDCKHITPVYVDDGYPVVSTGNVKPFRLSLNSARKVSQRDFEVLSEDGRKPIVNDIVYSRNASVGAAAMVTVGEEFCLGQDICLIRSGENQKFIEAALNSGYVLNQLKTVLVGSTFKRINIQQIKEFILIKPPLREQEDIVEYLELKNKELDETLDKIKKELDLMEEYRRALISEAVAGKIKVV
jgi:type I restriction enzyme, S subunit